MRLISSRAYAASLAFIVLVGAAAPGLGQPGSDPADALFHQLFVEQKLDESRLSEAFTMWTGRANRGEAKSQFYLSYLYFGGLGPAEMNVAKALELVHASAEQGYAEAQYKLGNAYEFGQGHELDYASAVRWYERAARQGYWLATERLAAAYANAELGLARDQSKAEFWRAMRTK